MATDEQITSEEMAVFLQEADEQLQLLDEDLVDLEKDGDNSELMQEIFRAAHTIKGSSAMAGFEEMSHVAHAMENVLDKLRNHTLTVNVSVIDTLLVGLDALKALREKIVSGEGDDVDTAAVILRLGDAGQEKTAISEGCVTFTPDEGVLKAIKLAQQKGLQTYDIKVRVAGESPLPAVRCFQAIRELAAIGEVLGTKPSQQDIDNGDCGHSLGLILASAQNEERIESALGEVPELEEIEVKPWQSGSNEEKEPRSRAAEKPADGTPEALPRTASTGQTVRVDITLLDTLMNLVGEMVVDRNRVRQISRSLATRIEGDELAESLEATSTHIMKLVDELQSNILKARMLPIGIVFNGLPRLVRDLAQKAVKQVNFSASGHETEFDRTIIEQVRDPLIHLLRNAVDHGIEPPQKRIAAGKPEEGNLHISSHQEQNHIVITIEDDGGGIDLQKVRSGAVRKGMLSAEEASRLSDQEATDLIFVSGLSTAENVTEVSGRGVGMDVVRTNIETLGGSVAVESVPGEGCRFIIRLPLTLATTSGLLVMASDTFYLVPMMSVMEVLQIKSQEIETITGREIIRARESIVPLLFLDDSGRGWKYNGGKGIVVVIRNGSQLVGLVVDSVIEPLETVVKPLGKYIGNAGYVAGATILGDGKVALILDTALMVKTCSGEASNSERGEYYGRK